MCCYFPEQKGLRPCPLEGLIQSEGGKVFVLFLVGLASKESDGWTTLDDFNIGKAQKANMVGSLRNLVN